MHPLFHWFSRLSHSVYRRFVLSADSRHVGRHKNGGVCPFAASFVVILAMMEMAIVINATVDPAATGAFHPSIETSASSAGVQLSITMSATSASFFPEECLAEAMYVESAAGAAGLEEAVKDMSVGALAYDTVPLSSASKLDPFSTEFQSLVTDKGAMILHMLRWVLGEDKYNKTMREFAETYAGKSATMDDFRTIAEKYYGDQLTWFFSQWLDSTGAPEFKLKYTTYRLARCKQPKE